MKTLKEIEILLTQKETENKEAIQEYIEKIAETDKIIQQANDDLTSAEQNANLENFQAAKDAIWSAQHARELYQKQKDKRTIEPLVAKDEYHKLLSEITQIADMAHEEQNNQAAALIAELKGIADESSQTSQQANMLMHKLQREVFKEPAGKILLANGETTWSSDKEYKNHETVHKFYQSKIQGTLLAKRSGEQPEQPRLRTWGQ